jgi:hypothetical protein
MRFPSTPRGSEYEPSVGSAAYRWPFSNVRFLLHVPLGLTTLLIHENFVSYFISTCKFHIADDICISQYYGSEPVSARSKNSHSKSSSKYSHASGASYASSAKKMKEMREEVMVECLTDGLGSSNGQISDFYNRLQQTDPDARTRAQVVAVCIV